MISIITVNWNSYDWLQLLIESVELYTKIPYEIIAIDNSECPIIVNKRNVKHILNYENIGHGAGLNLGIKHAVYPNIVFFDVDCHVLSYQWETYCLNILKSYDVLAGRGVPEKPIRPAFMALKKEIAQTYDWNETQGYDGTPESGLDVAIHAYYEMLKNNVKIYLAQSKSSRYQTISGEDWYINDQPICYHHWHGASIHLSCRQAEFPSQDLTENKKKLFKQIPWRIL